MVSLLINEEIQEETPEMCDRFCQLEMTTGLLFLSFCDERIRCRLIMHLQL